MRERADQCELAFVVGELPRHQRSAPKTVALGRDSVTGGNRARQTPSEEAMSLDADLIVDRRRMRRKLTFWRVLAILVVI